MAIKAKEKFNKIQRLLVDWEEICRPREINEDEAKVKVHQMVSKIAWGYEKFRALIDSGHGHQECYRTIDRILKRLLLLEKRKEEKIPQLLIEELIRAGFLKNNAVPKSDLKDIQRVLDKYIILMSKISVKISQTVINKNISKRYGKKRKREINQWLMNLCARELERFLLPKNKEEVLVKSMYEFMIEQIDISAELISPQKKKMQVYIATQRALLSSENGILSYYLFKLQCPNWSRCDESGLEAIAQKIFKIKENIERQLNHPIGDKLKRLCASNVVCFLLLFEILNEIGTTGFARLIKDQEALEKKITETVKRSYKRLRKKVRKGMFKSTLYVFITKSIVVEVALRVALNFWELAGVMLSGPTLMLLVGLSIPAPPEKNTKKIIKVFKRMIFEDKIRTAPYQVKQVAPSFFMNLIFVIFYVAIFTGIIWVIYLVLGFYGFDAITTSITLFFFSMIAYFGFRLREIMREYVVLDRKENFFGFIFDFIALPILKLGQMFVRLIDILNITKPIFDYVLESPFKGFVEFFENWTHFVKEKKEELEQEYH